MAHAHGEPKDVSRGPGTAAGHAGHGHGEGHGHGHDHAHGHGEGHGHAHGHGHDHGHAHGHGHHHHHHAADGRAFAWSFGLNLLFVVVELVYGFLADSMALLADAIHNLGDVAGLGLAWGATRLARIEPSDRRTYGWRKTTVVAALANAILVLMTVGGVLLESFERLFEPAMIDAWSVIVVAGIGVVINGGSAALFFRRRHQDVNIGGAFVHLAADAAVSVGVVLSGLAVLWFGWIWVDPVVSIVVSAVIVWGTWGLLRTSFDLAVDAVPPHIDLDEVRGCLSEFEEVCDVHDLHVWAMSTSETALTAHLEVPANVDSYRLLTALEQRLRERFGIEHTTLQLEPGVVGTCGQGRAGAL